MTRLRRFSGLALLAIPAVMAAQPARSDTIVRTAGAPKYPRGGSFVKVLTIGDANGAPEYTFTSINDVLQAADGNIWVLEATPTKSARLIRYDATGKFLNVVARAGQGPGEFSGAAGLAQLPDGRVVVRDINGHRVNVYSADGKPVATWRQNTSYVYPVGGVNALVADRWGVVWLPFDVRSEVRGGPIEDRQRAYLRIRPDGTILDTVTPQVQRKDGHRITVRMPSGFRVGLLVPFSPSVSLFVHPAGHLGVFGGTSYAVNLLQPRQASLGALWREGDPVVSIRRSVPPIRMSSQEHADQTRTLQERIKFYETGTVISGPVPDIPRIKPPIRGVEVGADGRLWVWSREPNSERFTPSRDQLPEEAKQWALPVWSDISQYDLFEPSGEYLGRLAPIPNTTFRWRKGDEILGVELDSDGVQTLVKYRIVWK